MSDVLVVSGPPGAGKSTVAALLLPAFERAALVPGDDFFGFLARGAVLPWLPEAHEQNDLVLRSAAAAAAAGTLAAGGCPVVYDAVLLPSLPVCRQRVADRTGHGFTDAAATERMHADLAEAAHRLEPRHVLADPPGRAADVAALLLRRYRAGHLTYSSAP